MSEIEKPNRVDHQPLVERWIETARRVDGTFGRIEAAFMANPENEIRSAIWDMFGEYTSTLAAIISDDAEDARGWLEWFAWECDFGRKPKEMIFSDGETLFVVGASDLLAAIHADENGRRVRPSPHNVNNIHPKSKPPSVENPRCASLIVHDPSDLPKCDGEILVALWGANEWEIVNVRQNVNWPFTAEYKSTGNLADPSEWQWWADLHCMILHNATCSSTGTTEKDHE